MRRHFHRFIFLGLAFQLSACGDDSAGTASGGASDSESGDDSTGISSASATQGTTSMDSDSMASDSTSSDATTSMSSTESDTQTGTGTDTDTEGDTDTDGDTEGDTEGDTDTGGIPCDEDADCDDLLFCTGTETCVAGFCQPGEPIECDDEVDCTVDTCDEVTQGCIYTPNDAFCDNMVFCDGQEQCDAVDGCMPGNPVECNDGIDCTEDSCDETNEQCSFVPDDGFCDNEMYCDGAEFCSPTMGCQNADPIDCNDFIPCTMDSCNEEEDRCDHDPDHDICQNQFFCDGVEVCDVDNGCMPGDPVMCADDGELCTVEACDEQGGPDQTGGCETTLDNSLCPDGQFCSSGGCQTGAPCNDDTDCDDGNLCNGIDLCDTSQGVPGTCVIQPGSVVNCNDGFSCTVDSCDPDTGLCTNAPNDAACVDTNLCNGTESCDPENGAAPSGCVAGEPLVCDDEIDCTADQCFAQFGCFHTPNNALCQDDSVCNGQETCDAEQGCMPAEEPLQCPSDGIACTTEVCDDAFGGCRSIPDDSLCDCGDYCDTSFGCSSFCAVATCGNSVYECGNCLDDDGDCRIDSRDPDCFGPCDNNESGFKGEIPGQNSSPCRHDCYFDGDTGQGNDDCYWSHRCDPEEPQDGCAYNPNANIPGTSSTCAQLQETQSDTCLEVCGPVVPNGCDCFGCCEVNTDSGTRRVWLGSEIDGDGSCNSTNLDDPVACRECTQVTGCLNPCEECEICFGETTIPAECEEQVCQGEQQLCGQAGQDPCPPGQFCLTGCCVFF
jgi:hypothetical protein